jgi:hypothetical protein
MLPDLAAVTDRLGPITELIHLLNSPNYELHHELFVSVAAAAATQRDGTATDDRNLFGAIVEAAARAGARSESAGPCPRGRSGLSDGARSFRMRVGRRVPLRRTPPPRLDKRERGAPASRLLQLDLRFVAQPLQDVRLHQREQSRLKGGGELQG